MHSAASSLQIGFCLENSWWLDKQFKYFRIVDSTILSLKVFNVVRRLMMTYHYKEPQISNFGIVAMAQLSSTLICHLRCSKPRTKRVVERLRGITYASMLFMTTKEIHKKILERTHFSPWQTQDRSRIALETRLMLQCNDHNTASFDNKKFSKTKHQSMHYAKCCSLFTKFTGTLSPEKRALSFPNLIPPLKCCNRW